MLIIKEPIRLNCKETIHTVNEGFCHRIRDNYHLMTAEMNREELLHMVTSPPEIYLAEPDSSQIMNQTLIFNQKEINIEMMNNLLNRLSMNQEVHLTYQDKIYIDNVLRKLGIKNTAQFIQEINKQKLWNQSQEEKMENYWNLLEQYQQGEDIQTQITNAINNKREDIQEEQRSYLHEFIMNRLQTGVIYRIMENFSEANTYHSQWMEQQQIQLSEQKKISHQIFLNQLENYFSKEEIPFVYMEKNQYETVEGKEFGELREENISQQIIRAVLYQLLNNIHMERLIGNKKEERQWFHFQNSLYQSAENTIFRMKNQVQQLTLKELENREVRRKEKEEREFYAENQLILHKKEKEEESSWNGGLNKPEENYYDNRQISYSQNQNHQIEVQSLQNWEVDTSSYLEEIQLSQKEIYHGNDVEKEGVKKVEKKEDLLLKHPEPKERVIEENLTQTEHKKELVTKEDIREESRNNYEQRIERIKEEIKNWENYQYETKDNILISETLVTKTEENQVHKQKNISAVEELSLEHKTEIFDFTEGENRGEKEENVSSNEERIQEQQTAQLYQQLQEINKKNIENWEVYQRLLEEQKEGTRITRKTMEEKKLESLKALQSPQELMLEYKKEAGSQLQQQEETKRQVLEQLPKETRKIYELIEAYQQGDSDFPIAGITKNDLTALTRDTQLVFREKKQLQEEKNNLILRETQETEQVLERWRQEKQALPKLKEEVQRQREVSLIHKQNHQAIEEEVLKQLLEENRTLTQKQIQNEVLHKEQVRITTVENREEHHIAQKNNRDIAELIDRGVKRQIGVISDQVYHRLEKKLSNEKKRRGF